ncbi:type VI secretion system protein TssL [Moritella sp. 5]|uniref:type VI secretion system protein TssL, long form n=1 Tax=Moritella sp. 5 TaxID=2746231 RepID=UPI001BA84573|nr:type VI secretion system protein TssL, long form [Moritella sp. 5]QUM80941.1 type VI secretion system protein TssL [Moritella sp. 5]
MSEKTIFKPRPGGRSQPEPTPSSTVANAVPKPGLAADDNNTLFVQPQHKAFNQTILTIGANPLIEHAGIILSLINQLRVNNEYEKVDVLHGQCIDIVDKYERQLHALKYENKLSGKTETTDNKLIDAAKFCVCAFIDETVMTMPWGRNSAWAQNSLQSHFYHETFGGEHFYQLLDESVANMVEMVFVVELQYLCLSLGYQGKYRVTKNAEQLIESLRDNLGLALKNHHGRREKRLSDNLQVAQVGSVKAKFELPIWVTASIAAALLAASFIGLRFNVNENADLVYQQVLNLVDRKPEATSAVRASSLALKLEQLLQTEIGRNIVVVQELSDRISIRLISADLFASGSDKISPAYQPIIRKIARALESTQGQILITGHTDKQQIISSRYPSNWHLSLARATSIADVLAKDTRLSGRLLPEGRGSSEPLVTGSTISHEQHAQNRRVEIDILR